MTILDILKWLLKWPGYLLYTVTFFIGYLWGFIVSGFYDGRTDAYRETE